MQPKSVLISMDVEEWYQIPYLQDVVSLNEREASVLDNVKIFLDLLDDAQVKATFFVVATIAKKRPDIILEIVRRGHEIGCHGMEHKVLYDEDPNTLRDKLVNAKAYLEEVSQLEVKGFRAPMYSITQDIVELIAKCGFTYDASYIRTAYHDYYGRADFSTWNRVSDYVFEKNGFYEFEMPSIGVGSVRLPWAGGGYFRLLPYPIFQIGLNVLLKTQSEYLFYTHPYEIKPSAELPNSVPLKNRLRYGIGRKYMVSRLKKFLHTSGVRFVTHSQYLCELV